MSAGQGNPHLNRGAYASQPQTTAPFSSMHMPGSISNLGMGMQQHHQYPGINSIPGMHSMSHMNGLQNMHGLQSMPGMQSFQNIPGIATMQSLLHPPQETNHHALSTSHLSNQFATPGVLTGGVDKRRKARKMRNLGYSTLLSNDDATTMIMAHHAAQVATHADPVGGLSSPSPVYEADGIQFKVLEQLPDTKIQRLRTEKIKPIEVLTYSDIKAYNRNQLRAYCSVYGIRRKKKADMERDMARYAALFHPNDPNFDWQKFEPTEYANGVIPRRKVPVTKEQKEKAAGDSKRLTSALQQRPQTAPLGTHHYSSVTNTHHHALSNAHHNNYHMPLSAPRLPDIHGTHHSTAHSGHTHHIHQGHPDDHDAGVGVAASELMSVPEMHVPNHLLSISHQITEE